MGLALLDEAGGEGDLAAGCDHFDCRASAGREWGALFGGSGGEEVGLRGVEGGVAHDEVEAEIVRRCLAWHWLRSLPVHFLEEHFGDQWSFR